MISALALGISGGVASADRYRGGVVAHPVGGVHYAGGAHFGGGHVYGGGRVYVGGYDRHPIYMHGPVIREHYYNYYRRPELIVENYGPRDGYVWVRGHWAWDGAEWTWAPGFYQPVY